MEYLVERLGPKGCTPANHMLQFASYGFRGASSKVQSNHIPLKEIVKAYPERISIQRQNPYKVIQQIILFW